MLQAVVAIAVPVLVFLTMVIVGLQLTAPDFRRVLRQPLLLTFAAVGQLLVLPLLALGLVRLLEPAPDIEAGILLVAVCPSGTAAGFYAYLGRANAALAIALTVLSCFTAVPAMPLWLAAFRASHDAPAAFDVPVPVLAGHLLLLLFLPVLLGMLVRRRRPLLAQRHEQGLLRVSLAALAALVAFILFQELERFFDALPGILLAVTALTLVTLLTGLGLGWAGGAAAGDRFALALSLVVRNLGIATAVAVTVLDRTEFAVFAAAYFVAQVPLVVAAVALFRFRTMPGPAAVVEVGQP